MAGNGNGARPDKSKSAAAARGAEPLGEWLRPRKTSEQIADRLITALALGEFVAGQKLPSERALAARLGVSRGRVRAALHDVAERGYVEIHRGRHGGATVCSTWDSSSPEIIRRTLLPDWRQIEQLLDLLSLIEPLIAKTAAERRSASDLRAIEAASLGYREASDRSESSDRDRAFHLALAEATGNDYLAELRGRLNQEVTLGFRAHPYSAEIRAVAIEHHDSLSKLIAERRGDDAAALMTEHLQLTERALRDLVAKVKAADDRN